MMQNIFILTGAGISAESGLQTFRGEGGLWRNFRAEQLATPEAFRANPELVLDFYNERRRQLLSPEIKPNPAHRALARLESIIGDSLTLVTQNVDDLHERGGSQRVIHMHGELLRMRCDACGHSVEQRGDFFPTDSCVQCNIVGQLRPDVVWFGEMPRHMSPIMAALEQCDTFIAVGTSGNVYPAAGFVELARRSGAHAIEVNPEPTPQPNDFSEHRSGPAGALLPLLVAELIAATGPRG
jgi:NAD-dependent deacetylase